MSILKLFKGLVKSGLAKLVKPLIVGSIIDGIAEEYGRTWATEAEQYAYARGVKDAGQWALDNIDEMF